MKAWTWMAAGTVMLGGNMASAASSDFYLKIDSFARPGNAGPIFLKVHSTGDLDGDGRPDDALLRLVCADGKLKSADYSIKGPRDASTGQASGREGGIMHADDWNPPAGKLAAMTLKYDLKNANAKGGRLASGAGGWTAIDLIDAGALCGAAEAASATVVKSKSNITNN